uniref:BTB domain-containing protein n=1 Tax=Oryza barthii TaxID=65489 RepID=A0A0D3F456_9ORYZ
MDGTDVTFDIGQDIFSAHKCKLAARSSVFKAEFFGAMSAKARRTIKIEDMEAGVFRSLLHFIYTDALPETALDVVMTQHLLVAADRYNVERLKLICEEKLSKHIDSNMVATTLALAEQHSCHGLKEACFEFLSSDANLERMKTSEGYEHLKVSCPSVLKELIARFISPEMEAAREITMDLQMANHCNNTSSVTVAEVARGSHVIKIDGYLRTKELMENGKYVSSIPFSVGGHSWFITYFPNGVNTESKDYLSVFLTLDSACAGGVKATFSFALLDKNGRSVQLYSKLYPLHTFTEKGSDWGHSKFMKKTDLERSVHLSNDSFSIMCDLTVMKDICSKETTQKQFVVVPPSDLHQHLGDLLLKNMDGTDVTFNVGQDIFSAHKCILAARSSVFTAEFFSAMSAKARRTIKIEDIEAGVFRALLHFIYTDSLPATAQDIVMAQHLVAADRYNVGRLKLICEEKLSKHIDSNMVATTLALAEQHSCYGLKEACFEFLASHSNLERMMASDDYEHLKISCPSVLMELVARFLPQQEK